MQIDMHYAFFSVTWLLSQHLNSSCRWTVNSWVQISLQAPVSHLSQWTNTSKISRWALICPGHSGHSVVCSLILCIFIKKPCGLMIQIEAHVYLLNCEFSLFPGIIKMYLFDVLFELLFQGFQPNLYVYSLWQT